jgi:hypothetical protein
MRKPIFAAPLLLFCLLTRLPAATWLFPGDAIRDLRNLERAELFDTWQPQSLPEDPRLPDGHYAEYQHETLHYFFGPFGSDGEARLAAGTLEEIRRELTARDPRFQSSRTGLSRVGADSVPAIPGLPAAETPAEEVPASGRSPEPAWDPEQKTSRPLAFLLATLLILALSAAGLRAALRPPRGS